MAYIIRLSGESTKDWLERLIVLDAPQDIRGHVRAILESESRSATQQAGILFIYILYIAIPGLGIFNDLFHNLSVNKYFNYFLISNYFAFLFIHF